MDRAETSSNVGLRVLVGVIGGLLVLAGALAWTLQRETSSLPYRVVEAPGGRFGAYWVEDPDSGQFEIEQLDDAEVGVVQIDGEESTVLFSGTEEEAAFWFETRGAEPAFTGSRSEVESWVDEQDAAEDDLFWPLTLLICGGALVLGAVALRERRLPIPRQMPI